MIQVSNRGFEVPRYDATTDAERQLTAYSPALQRIAVAGLSAVVHATENIRLTHATLFRKRTDLLAPAASFSDIVAQADAIGHQAGLLARAGGYVLEAVRLANDLFTARNTDPGGLAGATAAVAVEEHKAPDIDYLFDFAMAHLAVHIEPVASRATSALKFLAIPLTDTDPTPWAAIRVTEGQASDSPAKVVVSAGISSTVQTDMGVHTFSEANDGDQFAGLRNFVLAAGIALSPQGPTGPTITTKSL